ncbi:isopeptide-forming domain-containing fimbrial protein [Pelagerythrobacter marensis]|uniref:Isopeptide-forming domain-containing fimbrial protein n=1 Tax=Pelagerythrobacter marensis TaxID=543877 RepID=A0ABZ2D4Z0_9SPHN
MASLLAASLVLAQFFFFASPAHAQATPPPFSGCTSDVYLGQNNPTQLFRVDTTTNPFTYPNIGPAYSGPYNAIAFNPADNYIYGLDRPSGSNIRLLRIGSNGAVQVVGTITGGNINVPSGLPVAGEIGADGFFYVKYAAPGDQALYRVDLSTRVATRINLSQPRSSVDLAWYNGLLYSHDSNTDTLYTIDPSSGQVQDIGPAGVSGAFGAFASASNGVFGINNSGGFYQFNLLTGNATLISSSPSTTNNDGAKCYSTPLQFGVDLAITKTDNRNFYTAGTSTTYSIVVSNSGPFGVQGAVVDDPLPTGTTAADWTCGDATGGGVCGQASGSGAIAGQTVDLPVGASVTFSMTLEIPSDYSGDLTNTATVTPPDTALETDPSNNSATDVDAGVEVAKSLIDESGEVPGSAEPGEQLTYQIALTNTGSVAVSGYSVIDTLDANTSFVSATNGGAPNGGDVEWTNLSIPAGGSLALSVVVEVDDPLPPTLTEISNIARDPNGSIPPCPSSQCVVTPVAPAITYAKSTSATDASVGDVISYTLTAEVFHSPTTDDLTLTDTLGPGLDFTEVTDTGAFTCTPGNPLECILPAGTPVGVYELTYTATVNASATGSVTNAVVGTGGDDPTCAGSCDTDTPVVAPDVTYAKTADTAGPVSTGDVITFTLTTTITNSLITSDVVLTDTLGTGLDFVAVTDPGIYGADTSGDPVIEFTLPAGTEPGTYEVSYTAVVAPEATGSVSNVVVGSGDDNPACTVNCGTDTPVEETSVTYGKSVTAPGATVAVGDVLTYTLSVAIANSPTTEVLTLTDTLGTGLDFTAVTDTGAFTCTPGNPLECTLPAGTPVGTYDLTYTATVNDDATGSVTNAVLGTGGDNPSCSGTCDTSTTVASSAVTYAKSTNATQVKVGDTIAYTLTATVANSQTTGVFTLTDTLGTGLDFTAVTDAGAFTCTPGNPLECTLPAGTPVGSYSLTYTATVNDEATGSVTNAVLGTGPDNPSCGGTCDTNTPVVAPDVTYAKTADTAGPVSTGDIITFTLTTTVANSKTTSDVVLLTDTLGTGLDFVAVTDAGPYGVDTSGDPVIEFTLPAGAGPGTYAVSYTARVNEQASGSVSNVVVGSGNDNPTCTVDCGTDTTVTDPNVTYGKSTDAAQVKVGDTIAYTLTATVANAATNGVLTLTDTLGTGLDFTAVTDAGAFTCTPGNPLECTLPAGTPVGSYSLTYTATVNDEATGSVTNAVLGTGPDNPSCGGTCDTDTPVVAPDVTYAKTADTAGPVSTGDIITFTLTTTVANSKTTSDVVLLTDTLGTGLDFVAVTDAGPYGVDTSGDPVIEFTLPAGAGPGTYAVSYTARVNEQASGSVSNVVVGSGNDNPTCTVDCGTNTTVEDSAVTYGKSVNAPSATVSAGDVLSYELTVTVANSPTTDVVTLTDTLGAGLDFNAVTDTGLFTCNAADPLECTLPAGTPVGSYSLTYTATVNDSATGSVTNAVVGSGGDDPSCVGACTTETDVTPSEIGYAKSANAAQVKVGDTITYTLTATVANSATTDDFTLTDTLGAGLDFAAVTDAGAFACTPGNPLECTLPAGTPVGTYDLTYTATVNASAGGSVTNAVVGSGGDNPACDGACETETPLVAPEVSFAKTADTAGPVGAGDVITFTLTTTVANSKTTSDVALLTDTLGDGLDFVAVADAGAYGVDTSGDPVIEFTLPAGTGPGTYAVSYTARVNEQASGSVSNVVVGSGDDNPTCTTACGTSTTVTDPSVTYGKRANAAQAKLGDTIAYTLDVTVANAPTTDVVTLTDTLGSGLDFAAITDAGAFTCNGGGPLVCTLPAGTLAGVYSLTYTATVNGSATGSVRNTVRATGGDNPACDGACETETPLVAPEVSFAKAADTAGPVSAGDIITFTLTTTVANSKTTSDVVLLTDTLGTGLDFVAVTDAGPYGVDTSGDPVIEFTLPAGAGPGDYEVTYTARVNEQASGSVSNVVVGSGDDNPTCTTACGTDTTVADPAVTYAKSASAPADTVRAGDTIAYTLTVTVANSATVDVLTLTDTLGSGLDFAAITDAGAFTCDESGPLVCTLPAGTAPGSYAMTYTATVNATASGAVTNSVVGSGTDGPGCADTCTTSTPVATSLVSVSKSADPAAGETVQVGQTLTYALVVTIADGAITEPLVLVDTPGQGLTVTDLPAACEATGETVTCTLPAGTPVGRHELVYSATVNDDAGETVRNMVTATGGGSEPNCEACVVEHQVDLPLIRLVKTAAVREVRIGDLVRYTLSVENVGTRDLVAGSIVDTPPAGFTYVEDSLQAFDADGAATVSGQSPLRFENVDVEAGETATLAYLMRVGAGVRPGTHINQAQVRALDGLPVSNPATAQVELVGDPLIDDSLIFGTVFDDRDGDGWQDSAALSGLHVQGGFAPDAYVPGSTRIDRGEGMRPEPDESAPLLHGIRLGRLSARQSESDPIDNHRIVIRQRLSALSFTDDFVLTNAQGVTVRMDAAGQTSVEKSGDAAKGLNGAEPRVERRVAQGEGGYIVDYVVENAGIDERGIPGVRIASVEGLIMETDQFGRYHLAGIPGGEWRRGRNFILKVDPATLPDGATFTTDNPKLRRITPGIPVRFDWGVKLPVIQIEGVDEEIELEMGRIIFAPGSAEVSEQYLPAIERMAAMVHEYRGGEVVIDATAEEEALAYERAHAVRAALLARLQPEAARNLRVVARGEASDPSSMIVGVDEGGALLGTVLFDTDKADIRPQFEPLLDRIAEWIAAQGGGTIAIVGHTDVRGSFDYNSALGMRRARAVYQALADRVPPDIRSKIRVEASDDPAAPINEQHK